MHGKQNFERRIRLREHAPQIRFCVIFRAASGRSTETGSKKPARLTPLCRYRHTATRAIAQYTSDPVSSASNGAM